MVSHLKKKRYISTGVFVVVENIRILSVFMMTGWVSVLKEPPVEHHLVFHATSGSKCVVHSVCVPSLRLPLNGTSLCLLSAV